MSSQCYQNRFVKKRAKKKKLKSHSHGVPESQSFLLDIEERMFLIYKYVIERLKTNYTRVFKSYKQKELKNVIFWRIFIDSAIF